MNAKPVAAEIYTASHRILGRIHAGPSGLFSYLNLPTRSYTEIVQGTISRIHEPGRMPTEHSRLWLTKPEMFAVLLNTRADIGAAPIARRGYSSTILQRVQIIMGNYELSGKVETVGKFDYSSFFFESETIFMPLYDAVLKAILFPNVQAQSQALLFNREKVDAVAALKNDG